MQVVATLVPCFQQWTGINSVMFYAPIIFKTINPQSGALLATMITGVINVLATFISIAFVEKAGRKVSAAILRSISSYFPAVGTKAVCRYELRQRV